jgi:hypothetical protein
MIQIRNEARIASQTHRHFRAGDGLFTFESVKYPISEGTLPFADGF